MGFDFMGPLNLALKLMEYIILAIDYCTKWVEAKGCIKSDIRTTTQFLNVNMIIHFP